MKCFLLVFDRAHSTLLRCQLYDHARDAFAERLRVENENSADTDIEVVVLNSPSEAALRKTHARYFETFRQIAAHDSIA